MSQHVGSQQAVWLVVSFILMLLSGANLASHPVCRFHLEKDAGHPLVFSVANYHYS